MVSFFFLGVQLFSLQSLCHTCLISMLRLALTKISLDSRDLTWHTDRHEDRQNRRANGQTINIISSFVDPPDNQEFTLSYRFPRPPLNKQNVASKSPLDSIISSDPVPRAQDSFWDSVLADATSVPRIHSQNLARHPLIVEPSFLEYHNSTKGSVQGSSNHSQDFDGFEDRSIVTLYCDDSGEEVQASTDEENVLAVSTDNKENPDPKVPSKPAAPRLPGRHRRSLFSCYRRAHENSAEDPILAVQARFSGQLDMHGSSDELSASRRYWTRSSTTDSPTWPGYDGLQEENSTAEVSASEAGTDGSSSPISEPVDDSTSPQLPLPRSVELCRRRSGPLPRSPLWISRTEISSSPEKRRRSPRISSEMSPADVSGLFSQPPRRRKKYKPRTETYSYVESERSVAMSDTQLSEEDLRDSTVTDYPQSSPPGMNSSPPNYQIHSSTPSPRNHPTPLATHINPNPRHPLPYLPSTTNPFSPALPPPFSATPRTVSFNLALPSSSSPHASLPSSPPLPAFISTSTPEAAPRTPNVTIYNDSLPPDTQPQTPVGLPRNGIPVGVSGGNPFGRSINAYFTAPAGLGRNSRTAGQSRGSMMMATPTRHWSRYERWEEQENASEAEEAERRGRRMRIGERRRGGAGERGWLEGTPSPERG